MFPAAILLVGINLRPTMAAIGPLLDALQRDTGLTDTGASLMTTVPVALMGGCLLMAGRLRGLLGDRVGVAMGLALILLSDLARWLWPAASTLLATAVVGGVGIALVQALIPPIIRVRAGARVAGLMGLYSTAIMGGALLSGVASPWVAQIGGWPMALGLWALPALAGCVVWGATAGGLERDVVPATQSPWRHGRAWLLLAFVGLGTGAYTLVLAWLPPFYTQMGWSGERAGALLGAVTFAEVLAGLAVSFWVDRRADRRGALFAAIGSLLIGLLCLALAPLSLAWVAAVLAGLGIGALFPLSLIVAMDHGRDAGEAGAIAGFVQGGGYGLAALLPLMAGMLRQHLADLTPAWWLMAGLCLVMGELRSGCVRARGFSIDKEFPMAFYTVAGRSNYVVEFGSGRPVLLLHGISNSGRAWAPQIPALVAAGYRVIVPDHAGHGASGPVDRPFGVGDLADDIEVLLAGLGIDRLDVVGLSLGGMVALELALRHPAMIGRMVVANSFPATTDPAFAAMAQGWATVFEQPHGPVLRLESSWPSLVAPDFQGTAEGMRTYQVWHGIAATADGASLAQVARGVVGFDVTHRLADLACPTLFLSGSLDRMSPPGISRAMAGQAPHGAFALIEGRRIFPMSTGRRRLPTPCWMR
jgi:CP family cyanate transporter-like MFS transporter